MRSIYDMMGKYTYPTMQDDAPREHVESFFQVKRNCSPNFIMTTILWEIKIEIKIMTNDEQNCWVNLWLPFFFPTRKWTGTKTGWSPSRSSSSHAKRCGRKGDYQVLRQRFRKICLPVFTFLQRVRREDGHHIFISVSQLLNVTFSGVK